MKNQLLFILALLFLLPGLVGCGATQIVEKPTLIELPPALLIIIPHPTLQTPITIQSLLIVLKEYELALERANGQLIEIELFQKSLKNDSN